MSWRRLWCRHRRATLQLEADRLALWCPDCDGTSPGWDLDRRPPTITAPINTRASAALDSSRCNGPERTS